MTRQAPLKTLAARMDNPHYSLMLDTPATAPASLSN
jgi:hypothetical protein